jgi:enoyl-CoA hydratase
MNLTQESLDAIMVEAKKIIVDMLEVPQPIIAAMNGAAAGLGATLGLYCDVIYAEEKVKIADPHVLIGVTAGDGGAAIWPALVGVSRAKEYLMTGDSLTATEAERIGLINHVTPVGGVMEKAMALATRLAKGSQIAIRSTKRSVNKALIERTNLTLELSLALEKECFSTAFHKKAVAALAESLRAKKAA